MTAAFRGAALFLIAVLLSGKAVRTSDFKTFSEGGSSQRAGDTAVSHILIADRYPGADIGAKIAAAIAACTTGTCSIEVTQGGTISTPFDLPMGSTLAFYPGGTYQLNMNWVIDHRGVTVAGNGAHFRYIPPSSNDSGRAIYVGKNISSKVNVSGTTVTWMGGSMFARIDPGDQVVFKTGSKKVKISNVKDVHGSTLSISPSVGNYTGVAMAGILYASSAFGTLDGQGVSLRDLTLTSSSRGTKDEALTLEMLNGAHVSHLSITQFLNGQCVHLYGAISSDFYSLSCQGDGYGIVLDQNQVGGLPAWTGSNANVFENAKIGGSSLAEGVAIYGLQGWGNKFRDLDVEGNANKHVIWDAGTLQGLGANLFDFADYEANGTGEAYEIDVETNDDVLEGPSQIESSTSDLIAVGGPETNVSHVELRNLQINASRRWAVAYRFFGASTGFVHDVEVIAGAAHPGKAQVDASARRWPWN
jgi:hypothetical protein